MTIKVWSWRQAIARAKLEPSTKLVLFILANYMNENGDGCYPTIDRIEEESGLTRPTVIKHIGLAEAAQFIIKKVHGFNGQGWARNEYIASYPDGFEIGKPSEGSKAILPPSGDVVDLQQDEGSKAILPSFAEAVKSFDEGSKINSEKAVKPFNPNSPVITPDNSPAAARARGDEPKQEPQAIDAAAALEIVKGFDIILAQEFGITAGRPEEQRKARHDEDMLQARKYLLAGADVVFCKQIFRRKMAQRKAMGGKAPGGLSYFSAIIPEEILLAKASGTAHREPSSSAEEKINMTLTIADIGEDTPENQGMLKILRMLLEKHGPAVYKSWFLHLKLAHKNYSSLQLSVPTRFTLDSLRQRYADDISACARQVWPEIKSVTFTLR